MARFLCLLLLSLSCVCSFCGAWQPGAYVDADGFYLEGNADKNNSLMDHGDLMNNPDLISNETDWEIIPHPNLQNHSFNITRRALGSFRICALCTCCGGRHRFCIPSACCYTITCGSPNRPFGLCSFTPVSCNCFGCHL